MILGLANLMPKNAILNIEILLLRCLVPDEQALEDAISGNQVAIEVTEQAIERPLENQGDYYSGKKSQILKRIVPVEHINRNCKTFKICGNRYRENIKIIKILG